MNLMVKAKVFKLGLSSIILLITYVIVSDVGLNIYYFTCLLLAILLFLVSLPFIVLILSRYISEYDSYRYFLLSEFFFIFYAAFYTLTHNTVEENFLLKDAISHIHVFFLGAGVIMLIMNIITNDSNIKLSIIKQKIIQLWIIFKSNPSDSIKKVLVLISAFLIFSWSISAVLGITISTQSWGLFYVTLISRFVAFKLIFSIIKLYVNENIYEYYKTLSISPIILVCLIPSTALYYSYCLPFYIEVQKVILCNFQSIEANLINLSSELKIKISSIEILPIENVLEYFGAFFVPVYCDSSMDAAKFFNELPFNGIDSQDMVQECKTTSNTTSRKELAANFKQFRLKMSAYTPISVALESSNKCTSQLVEYNKTPLVTEKKIVVVNKLHNNFRPLSVEYPNICRISDKELWKLSAPTGIYSPLVFMESHNRYLPPSELDNIYAFSVLPGFDVYDVNISSVENIVESIRDDQSNYAQTTSSNDRSSNNDPFYYDRPRNNYDVVIYNDLFLEHPHESMSLPSYHSDPSNPPPTYRSTGPKSYQSELRIGETYVEGLETIDYNSSSDNDVVYIGDISKHHSIRVRLGSATRPTEDLLTSYGGDLNSDNLSAEIQDNITNIDVESNRVTQSLKKDYFKGEISSEYYRKAIERLNLDVQNLTSEVYETEGVVKENIWPETFDIVQENPWSIDGTYQKEQDNLNTLRELCYHLEELPFTSASSRLDVWKEDDMNLSLLFDDSTS